MNELLARVDVTLERERAFVANASHQLRTPLALLKTELELAVRRPRPLEELLAALDSMAVEIDHLIRLTDDLLLLASVDESALSIVTEMMDPTVLLSRVADRFKQVAAQATAP